MARTHPNYFPFYPHDFICDGKVEAMSTQAVGAYVLLLCKAWYERPAGSIPDDQTLLARWARLTPDQWASIAPEVLSAFSLHDGRWVQRRMTEEFRRAMTLIRRKSEGGHKGALGRWGNGTAMGDPWHTHSLPNGIAMTHAVSLSVCSDSGSSPDGGDARGGVRTLWAQVQPIYDAYPAHRRNGKGSAMRAIGEALQTAKPPEGVPAAVYLLARTLAYAASWAATQERGRFSVKLERFFSDRMYEQADSDWAEPSRPKFHYRTKAEREAKP